MKPNSIGLSALAGVLALCAQASAQNINIDIDSAFGTPPSSFGAAGLVGTWNDVSASVGTSAPLLDTSGATTGVTITRTGGVGQFAFNAAGTVGADQQLMDDFQDVGGTGSCTWSFAGLAAGTYTVRTYAWPADDSMYRSGVSVNGGALTTVGGTWPGGYAVGITHAIDTVTIGAGGTIDIVLTTVAQFATCNGMQVQFSGPPPSPFTAFCAGDGTGTPCPCSNSGLPGNGCANSLSPGGANLSGAGTVSISADTAVLTVNNMPNSSALYFQGTAQVGGGAGATFGDGKRCAGGSVVRLGLKTNASGTSSIPTGADLPLHVKGNVVAGNIRTYQCWYRNADVAFCPPATFNLTNGVTTTWVP